jgi:hypothetical protein
MDFVRSHFGKNGPLTSWSTAKAVKKWGKDVQLVRGSLYRSNLLQNPYFTSIQGWSIFEFVCMLFFIAIWIPISKYLSLTIVGIEIEIIYSFIKTWIGDAQYYVLWTLWQQQWVLHSIFWATLMSPVRTKHVSVDIIELE